jgi:hypothetical protein
MKDYIEIGPVPSDEQCAQVGSNNFYKNCMTECKAFMQAIRKKLGEEPSWAQLSIKANPHDFGTYYEVVCYYDDEHPESLEYALKCESDAPRTWTEVGMEAPVKYSEKVNIK